MVDAPSIASKVLRHFVHGLHAIFGTFGNHAAKKFIERFRDIPADGTATAVFHAPNVPSTVSITCVQRYMFSPVSSR